MATEQQNRKIGNIGSNVTLNKERFLLVGNPQWLSTKFVFIYKVFNSGETVLQEHDDVQNKQRM
jgi:hypothetical protein